MIVVNKNQSSKSIKINDQSAIKFNFDKILLENENNNFVFSLPYEINVSSIIKGAKNIYSIVIYDKFEYSQNLKPKKIIVFDALKDINNDLLKFSTILSNSRFNTFEFDVIEKSELSESETDNLNRNNNFPFENFSKNNSNNSLENNKDNFELFLKTNELYFSKIESIFNFQSLDKNSSFENQNIYGETLKLSSYNSSTQDFDKNYQYVKKINNLKFKKSKIYIELEKTFLVNDLICFLTLGDCREKIINDISNTSIGYFELSNKRTNPNPDVIKEFEVNILKHQDDFIDVEIKNQSKISADFNISFLFRENNSSRFSIKRFFNTVLSPNQIENVSIKDSNIVKYKDLFLVVESSCQNIKNKTRIIKIKNSNQFKDDFLNKELKFQNSKIFSYINNDLDSIVVEAYINIGNSKDFTLLKRELSLNGLPISVYSKIPENQIERTKNLIVAIDKSIKHDKIYEYCIFDLKNLNNLNCKTNIFYRNPKIYPDKIANLNVEFINQTKEFDEFLVDVNFSFTKFEQILSSLQNSTNGNIVTSNANIQIGNFIDNIKNNRDKLSNIFQINVIIQDLESGFEYELGNFPAGNIKIDSKTRKSKNVPDFKNARYVFRLLQRDAITLFDDIEQTNIDPDTLAEFRFNISKFLSPLNLISNIIPSQFKKSKIFIEDEFLIGWTGISKFLIKNGQNDFLDSSVNIESRKIENKNIITLSGELSNESIGVIIFVNFKNIKVPVQFSSKENWRGDYLDPIYLIGPRKYEIYEILSDLSFGKNFVSNVIL